MKGVRKQSMHRAKSITTLVHLNTLKAISLSFLFFLHLQFSVRTAHAILKGNMGVDAAWQKALNSHFL